MSHDNNEPMPLGTIRGHLRALLNATPDEVDRARILYDVVQEAYDRAKFEFPGGGGLDGREGTERDEIGEVLEKAIDHRDKAVWRRNGPPPQ